MRKFLAAIAAVSCFFGTAVGSAQMAPSIPTAQSAPVAAEQPVTILVGLDGFRPDYLDRGITPNLSQMRAKGAFGRMRPSFPTKTFPNHFTLVTGLRPDHHGIVGNSMIDPYRPGQMFSLGDARQSLDAFWWTAEPIWITAEKHGVRTATMFWPGSEIGYAEKRDDPKSRVWRAQDWMRFDSNVSNPQRVMTVLDWMRRPVAIRPRFVTVYFDTVDTAGHRFGIQSKEVNDAIADVDARIGDLTRGLADLGITANIVVTADHGMADVSDQRAIQLDSLIDKASYVAVETGPYAAIEPVTGTDNRVYDALLKPHDHMKCYRKENLPPALNYGKNARVAAIVCLAETGWSIISGTPQYPLTGATHGWDNAWPEMDALFLATGPDIRPGTVLPTFDNVHVYALLAHLIGIQPQQNDGSIAYVAPIMRNLIPPPAIPVRKKRRR